MSQQKLDLQIKGLYTSPNSLSGVPAGALEVADNIVINSKNIAESRRGQTQYGSPLAIGSSQVNKMFNYASSVIVNYDNYLAYDSGNGVWVPYSGTYNVADSNYKMRSLEALKNFYFNTDKGIYKIDSLTSTPRKAGVVKALGGTGSLSGSSGFLEDNSAVAYRMIWGYKDANNNLLLGSPSQRLIVSNSSGGTRDVSLTFLIPSEITTEYFYQIYRSNGTLTATDEPSDELQLVLQGNCTSAEIAAKSFTVLDQTPYSLMRATLYTSPSVEGIANANNEPPYALDMAVFRNSTFYANIKQKQTLTISLIGVDTPSIGYITEATCDTTSGSDVLADIADTSALRIGMRAVGTGIPSGSIITEILTATTVRISNNATATATVSVEFQDRFTLAGVNYWGGSAQDVPTNTFKVDLSGTPSQNINETALNLVEIINKSTSNTTVYAYYISALDDLPGQILFEERSIGGSEFTATSTAGASFSPELPENTSIQSNTASNPTVVNSTAHGLVSGESITITGSNSTPSIDGVHTVTVLNANSFTIPVNVTIAGTSGSFIRTNSIVNSTNEARQNYVAISKPGQNEAVPAYTYLAIGSANFPIKRAIALRDGIFFFKDDGLFRVSGQDFSSYTVDLVDNTVTLLAPESAVSFNNQIFCFTDQGICAVTDAGVKIISVPIEDTLLELSSEQFTNFASASFGVAYESARQYMFFTVTDEDDEFATQAFVYNSLTDTWTRWPLSRTCGIVNPGTDKLMMAQPDTGQILIERKSFTNADYADEQYTVTINSVDSTTQLTLASASNVAAGMTIVQNDRMAYIEEVDGNVITTSFSSGFEASAATVYTPIENAIKWAPIDAENPGILKQFSEISLFFKNAAFREIDASFSTNVSPGKITVTIDNATSASGFGYFDWGGAPWGGALGGANVLRTYVPRDKQRAHWLSLSLTTEEAFTGFSLQGVSLILNAMSSRFR